MFSKTLNNWEKLQNDNIELSSNDSIIFDITEILKEEKNLSEDRREEIERRINSLPGRVIRRDTTSFFLQTALGIAYNEFVSEDYDKAISLSSNFNNEILEDGQHWKNAFRFFLIKYTPSYIKTKLKEKGDSILNNEEKEKSSSIFNLEWKRDTYSFLRNIFEGMPMNLQIATYSYILKSFKDLGGTPENLNGLFDKGFYNRCKIEEREDILNLIKDIWNLTDNDFEWDKYGYYKYIDKNPIINNSNTSSIFSSNDLPLSMFDDEGNISVIDSLISVNLQDSIGKYINNYQYIKIQKGANRDVIRISNKYEELVPEIWKPRFYNFWGTAHLALGENEEAADKFLMAIEHRTNKEIFSGAILNYALSLVELGKYDEAITIYETQENKTTSKGEQVAYWEGLGYIYSFVNRDKSVDYFRRVDSLIENSSIFYLNIDYAYLTRHFLRETRLLDDDLFKWRETLKKARIYAGEDLSLILSRTIHNALYHSEIGRYRYFLFDLEGASKDFEIAKKTISMLDTADYRYKWYKNSLSAVENFEKNYGKDKSLINKAILNDSLSPLHKIWLLCKLISEAVTETSLNDDLFYNGYVIDNLQSNLGATIMALSSDESKFLIVPVLKIQELLMPIEDIKKNPQELARLNLLRKGLLQTSKVALEKELMTGKRKADYEELKELRKRLNQAYIYEDSLRVRKLLPQISSKERELYYSMKDSLSMGNVISSNPQSICLSLRENDLAIDFIEYVKNNNVITGAFLYFPSGDIQYMDLLVDEEENKVEKFWIRLLPLMEGKDNIYFSPDGSLIHKGIEFYSDENGVPLFENYKLHRVSHLRDLGGKPEVINGEITVIGVSDHNSPIGEAGQLYRGDWTDLPNVEYEVKLIDTTLYHYPHRLLYNDDAIEEKVKAMDGNDISVIHFSTHGVYRSIDSLNYAASNDNHFDHNIALRTLKSDRQQISGIVLRKGNLTWQMPHLLDDEDDILTAEEIEVMNFPNLQLTVLSACDSGLGEINGEGIQGLQRAFKIAGSKNIICSLNKVDDYWSAQFMGELYKNIAEGRSIYDSFRNAQMNIKLAAPDNPVAWSSYILIE